MAFSKVKVGGLADDSVTAANIDDDGTGYTVGNLTNSGTLQQTGQVTLGSGGTNWSLPTARGTDKYVLQINGTTGASTWAESLVAPEISGHNFDVSGSTDDGGINAYEAPYIATGNTTNGSNSIASISVTSSGDDINDLKVGQFVSGTGIPANAVIKAISGTTITLKDNTTGADTNATATNTGTALSIQKTPGEKNGGKVILTGTNFGVNAAEISVAITTSGGSVIANASYITGLSATSCTAEWTGTEGSYSTDLTSSYTGKIYFKMTKSGLASNVFDTNTTLTSDATLTTLSTSSQTGGDRSATPSATSLGTYGSGKVAGGGQDSNTELLLNFDRGGGTDIEDSSNKGGDGHKVTRDGNAVIKSSPFADGKSAMFFDGTNDKLSIPDSADWHYGTGAFTIELWLLTTDLSNPNYIYYQGSGSSNMNEFYIQTNGSIGFASYDGAYNLNVSTAAEVISTNTWYHVAFVRDATPTLNLYVNGVAQSLTFSNSTSASGDLHNIAQPLLIGECGYNSSRFFKGYLDEIRIVKGTGVYTSDFTVPTSRLAAITNTKLLIHSNQQADDSPNGYIITPHNAITNSQNEKKYGGSSWKFDGTDDWLTVSDAIIPKLDAIGTGALTLELWFRTPDTTTEQGLVNFSIAGNNPASGIGISLRGDRSPDQFEVLLAGSNNVFEFAWSANTWYHIALTRSASGGTCRFFINGQMRNQNSATTHTFTAGNTLDIAWTQLYIGRLAHGSELEFEGYIDNLRLSNTERYTSNFTAGEVTSDDNTLLLVNGEGGTFTDSSPTTGGRSVHTITPTGAFHSQDHKGITPVFAWPANGKSHGSSGIYFDGDTSHGGDRITVSPAPTHMTTQGANTTVEFWFYCTGIGHRMSLFRTPLIDKAGIGCNFHFEIEADGGLKGWLLENQAYTYSSGSDLSIYDVTNFTTTFPNNQWHHFAFTHVGWGGGNTTVNTHGVANVFCDGKYLAPVGSTNGFWRNKLIDATEDNLCFGGGPTGSGTDIGSFKGYMDGIRVSDTIRYTGTSTSEWGNYNQPTRLFGIYGQETPDVGTITLVATGEGDYTWSEVAAGTALPGTLAVGSTTHSGSGNSRTHTATITGSFSENTTSTIVNGTRSDITTNGILLKAQNDADSTKAITLGSSGGYDGIGVTQKSTEKPVLFNGRRYKGNTTGLRQINGLGFQPDLVWIKDRDGTNSHTLADSVRGAGYSIYANTNNGNDTTANGITGFLNDGFQLGKAGTGNSNVGNNVNGDNLSLMAWTWKAGGPPSGTLAGSGATATLSGGIGNGTIHNSATGVTQITSITQSVNQNTGFSITKFQGAANGGTFPHNLGGTPAWVMVKKLGTSDLQSWGVWHKDLAVTTGSMLYLNSNSAETASSGYFDYSGVDMGSDTTRISIGANDTSGGSDSPHICYAWRAVAGVSAFGTYTGGTSNKTLDLDFFPRLLIIKRRNGSAHWMVYDQFRSGASASGESMWPYLSFNNNEEEYSSNDDVDLYESGSTKGVQLLGTSNYTNQSGGIYIYCAFA